MWVLLWLLPLAASFAIDTKKHSEPPRQIELWVGESVDKIQGFTWPPPKEEGRPSIASVDSPFKVTLHFPSGQRFTGWSNYMTFYQSNGTLLQVTIAPCPGYVVFHQSVEILEREVRKVRFQDPWDLFGTLAEWKKRKQLPEVDLAETGIVEERITLFVKVQHSERQAEKAWWCTMTFDFWEDKKSWEHYKKR